MSPADGQINETLTREAIDQKPVAAGVMGLKATRRYPHGEASNSIPHNTM